MSLRLRQLDGLDAVEPAVWDALFPAGQPLLSHAFLSALERHGCVTPDTGWTPCHALLVDADNQAQAAAPLYLKQHSWGEFVFDFAWADASQRLGRPYYPKLVNAIPFTPCTGPRIGARSPTAAQALATALIDSAQSAGLSGVHSLFVDEPSLAACRGAGMVERHDVQFHWRNAGYADFAAFLATFSSDKRKKLLRERRRVAEAGIHFQWRAGHELDEAEWLAVWRLYANTYAERGQLPYLSPAFFLDYGRRPDTAIRLVQALEGTRMVAVAILLRGDDTLYGRHWGAAEHYSGLHFETCYHQGIDYCIREGIGHFDAGAQGQHKLARGFVPEITRSAHWLADARLFDAVEDHLERERRWVGEREALLEQHVPYRMAPAADA